jgi:polysaccharide biosynthesis/export protein
MTWRMVLKPKVSTLVWFLAVLALAGCTNLPTNGPSRRAIENNASVTLVADTRSSVVDYVLVDITDAVLREVPTINPGSFYRTFGERPSFVPSFRIGVGDQLTVSIFESSSGGLFSPSDGSLRPGNFITLPVQTVAASGTIAVPYAGNIRVAGRTPEDVQRDIANKLSGRAVEPQVVVTLGEQVASSVTVIGDSSTKLQLRGFERVLDVIARAGATTRYPGHELFATLIRKGRSSTIYFPLLVRNTKENIIVAPGDIIYIYRQQQKFIAFGNFGVSNQTGSALGTSGFFGFDEERLYLSDAVAKAGGLQNFTANAQVFIYRMELREALERMGVDVRRFAGQEVVPTVYRANWRDPSVFFYAQRFPMRHKDAIYAANADSVQLEKFLAHTQFISSTVSGVAGDIVSTRISGHALARSPSPSN